MALGVTVKIVACTGILFAFSISGCADAPFQGLQVSNAGQGAVTVRSVLYGKSELILGPAMQHFRSGADKRSFQDNLSQGLEAPIAEQTQVAWVTDNDGVEHRATLPTKSLVKDRGAFYGFRFTFVDNAVDVYLVENKSINSKYLSLRYTKVYSSAGRAAQPGAPADVP